MIVPPTYSRPLRSVICYNTFVAENIRTTFSQIVSIDSTSKKEQGVASFVSERLQGYGFSLKRDQMGNVIAFLPGKGEPVLLNAHMDRVPPGKGNIPKIEDNIVRSDGSTNLGADDAAGIAIILEASRILTEEKKPHPPLVIALTVQEEIGLHGARALDLSEYGVKHGIVFDNAFAAGVIVSKGAAYIAFDAEVIGKEGHPGKDLSQGANAIQIFVDASIPLGESDEGQTRINIGTLTAGKARNVIPGNLTAQGEIRSFLSEDELKERVEKVRRLLLTAAQKYGAQIKFTPNELAVAYGVDPNEPLVKKYREVVEARGGKFEMENTFVASDANVLRGEKGLQVFTLSTGVTNEHSSTETVDLRELEQITSDVVLLMRTLANI